MNPANYKRVLIKLSGESLFNFDGQANADANLLILVDQIKKATDNGTQIVIVLGGGNICRGRNMVKSGAKRVTADNVGMLATVINSLVFRDILDKHGLKTKLYSAFPVGNMAGYFEPRQAIDDLQRGYVVISSGGTGNPLVSTDTAASLRAIQLEVDAMLKLTKVRGIYDKDPSQHHDAVFIPYMSYEDALTKQVKVMDSEAFRHCQMFSIPIHVAYAKDTNIISRILAHENVGTKVNNTGE